MQKTALDGTALDAWFDAAKVKPLSKSALGEVNEQLSKLAKQLGVEPSLEAKTVLSHAVSFSDDNAWGDGAMLEGWESLPTKISGADKSFLTGLVSSPLSGIAHFFGAVPIAVRLQNGCPHVSFVQLAPLSPTSPASPVFGLEPMTPAMFLEATSVSDWLRLELEAAVGQSEDELNVFRFSRSAQKLPHQPLPQSMAAEHEKLDARVRLRYQLATSLRRALSDKAREGVRPSRALWLDARDGVGPDYGTTMLWVCLSWMGRETWQAECFERASQSPSPFVRAFLEFLSNGPQAKNSYERLRSYPILKGP